jgi:hypothetical protein
MSDRYRTKPVEIEARQLTDDADWAAIATWCGTRPRPHTPGDLKDQLPVSTPAGVAWASIGDWIVKKSDEFEVVKRDEFEATYEPVTIPPPGERS